MAVENALLAGILTLLFGVIIGAISLFIISLLPTWFVIMGDWCAFAYWFPIVIPIARILGVVSLVLCPVLAAYYESPQYLILIPLMAILLIWGYPVILDTGLRLAMTELSGLELQRTLLQFIFLEFFSTSISIGQVDASRKEIKEVTKVKKIHSSIKNKKGSDTISI